MAKQTVTTTDDLAILRSRRGYASRSRFAQACGVDRVTVWRWEAGERAMSAEACRIVAGVLGVSMEDVLRAVENRGAGVAGGGT